MWSVAVVVTGGSGLARALDAIQKNQAIDAIQVGILVRIRDAA